MIHPEDIPKTGTRDEIIELSDRGWEIDHNHDPIQGYLWEAEHGYSSLTVRAKSFDTLCQKIESLELELI